MKMMRDDGFGSIGLLLVSVCGPALMKILLTLLTLLRSHSCTNRRGRRNIAGHYGGQDN